MYNQRILDGVLTLNRCLALPKRQTYLVGIMKKSFYAFIMVAMLPLSLLKAQTAAGDEMVCRIGLQYQLSYNEHWGANKPVLISVEPNSPAAKAGLRPGDVIEQIASKPTASMSEVDFDNLLRSAGGQELVVSNLSGKNKSVVLDRECRSRFMLSEKQLSESFSFYSMKDASQRRIVRPYKVTTASKSDFSNLRTFAFAAPDPQNAAIDKAIYAEVAKYLKSMGMKETVSDPDLTIDSYYLLDKNQLFTGAKSEIAQQTWQYNPASRSMELKPIMPIGTRDSYAPYVLQLGVRLINARNTLQVYWQCEANEFLSEPMSLEEYARLNVPLMMMEFPFIRYRENPSYRLTSNRYFYTGLHYQASDLASITYVDPSSPAAKAGLRAGDRLISINGVSMQHSSEEFSKAYKEFIKKTLRYRNESDVFTDVNGLSGCRYWNLNYEKKIAKQMGNEKYLPAFAYLFFFRSYVNPLQITTCVFQVLRDGRLEAIIVQPILRDDSYVTLE